MDFVLLSLPSLAFDENVFANPISAKDSIQRRPKLEELPTSEGSGTAKPSSIVFNWAKDPFSLQIDKRLEITDANLMLDLLSDGQWSRQSLVVDWLLFSYRSFLYSDVKQRLQPFLDRWKRGRLL